MLAQGLIEGMQRLVLSLAFPQGLFLSTTWEFPYLKASQKLFSCSIYVTELNTNCIHGKDLSYQLWEECGWSIQLCMVCLLILFTFMFGQSLIKQIDGWIRNFILSGDIHKGKYVTVA